MKAQATGRAPGAAAPSDPVDRPPLWPVALWRRSWLGRFWRRQGRAAVVRLAVGLVVVLLALEALLAIMVRERGMAAGAVYAAVAALTLLVTALAFSTLARRERRRQARLRAYARRYAEAVRWDEQLEALHSASLEIARENTYPAVLQTIVDLASSLARARFGALAVFDTDGDLEEFVTYGVSEKDRERIGILPRHRGLLGELSRGAAVRLDDVRSDPWFTGMPDGHPLFRTFLGVAVRWEGELLGHLYLGGHMGEQPFTVDEERLLAMFASEAGLAIARHRLYDEYARTVRSAERRRIAMGLHDRTLQGLYALALQLGRARRQGVVQLTNTMTVEAALAAVERSMASIRQLLDTLHGDAHEDVDEVVDVRQAVDETAAMCAVVVDWRGDKDLSALGPSARSEIAMCLCEAVTNAARHGRAHRVRVDVREEPPVRDDTPRLCLDVVDDGEGARVMAVYPGHGLSHIEDRVRALGGETRFTACEAGAGAGVHIRVPFVGTAEGEKGDEDVGSADSDR